MVYHLFLYSALFKLGYQLEMKKYLFIINLKKPG